MKLAQRLIEVKAYSPLDNALLMCDIAAENVAQVEQLRHAVADGEHIHRKGILKLRVLIQLIEYDLSVRVAAVLDNYAKSRSAALVADIGDALDALVLVALSHSLDERALIDLIWYLGDNDAMLVLLDLCARADGELSSARLVRFADAHAAAYHRAGRKIRSLDVFHQTFHGNLIIFHVGFYTVHDLCQVMRRDAGRHTDRDTVRPI